MSRQDDGRKHRRHEVQAALPGQEDEGDDDSDEDDSTKGRHEDSPDQPPINQSSHVTTSSR